MFLLPGLMGLQDEFAWVHALSAVASCPQTIPFTS
jgi:hypothetical protein